MHMHITDCCLVRLFMHITLSIDLCCFRQQTVDDVNENNTTVLSGNVAVLSNVAYLHIQFFWPLNLQVSG